MGGGGGGGGERDIGSKRESEEGLKAWLKLNVLLNCCIHSHQGFIQRGGGGGGGGGTGIPHPPVRFPPIQQFISS